MRIEALGGFYIHDSERPLILMGGGTGFAPIKKYVRTTDGSRFNPSCIPVLGGACSSRLYMDSVVRSWVERQPLLTYVPVLSEPNAAEGWLGRTGYVHAAVASDFPDLSGYDVYMSGAADD